MRTAALDILYSGRFLGGVVAPAAKDAHRAVSTDYAVLSRLFRDVTVGENDVLVDIGCGKGRVLTWWLRHFPNEVIGIEINEALAAKAKSAHSRYRNATVICGSVLDVLPERGTIFYMFNPFKRRVVEQFKERFAASLQGKNNVLLIYFNCVDADVFAKDPRFITEVSEINAPRAGIVRAKTAWIRFSGSGASESGD